MRSASIAEWIVGRFTSKKRAASVVGDLVELKPQKGSLWFWTSLIGVVVCLSWRSGLRLLAAFCVRGVASFVLVSVVIHYWPRDSQHWPPNVWLLWALSTSSTIGALLWMTLTYVSIRYGLRDKVTRLTLAWASLATVAISFWREPVVLFLCLAVSIGIVSVSFSKTRYRHATLVLWGTVATGYACTRLMDYLSMLSWHSILHSGQMKSHSHLFVGVDVMESFVVTWIAVMTCSRMHHWLVGNKLLNGAPEEHLA